MTAWTTTLYVLLPHPHEPLVLTTTSSGKIALPSTTFDNRVWLADTHTIKPLLEELVGARVNILRYVAQARDDDLCRMYGIQLLELRAATLPRNASWQPLENVLADSELPPALQAGLGRWQAELRLEAIPQRRAPWAFPGWYAQAEHWIADQVTLRGRGAIQSLETIKSWSISCLIKVTTDTGILYFKASRDLPLFVNEGAVMTRLAEIYPNRLPVPIAFEPEQNWMLLDEFGEALGWDAPFEGQAELMQEFARIQIDSAGRIDTLLAAGCKDRRLDALPAYIEPLFEDELIVGRLTSDERSRLRQLVPQIKGLIGELQALAIPPTLLHGDLHAGNVTVRDNAFLYFDWTDAAVSHPYFDMIHIFTEDDETKRTALQEAYLSVWEEQYPKAVVRRAWALAGTLYGLYHAVSYQHIVHGIEELVQPELNYGFQFLRKLLAAMETWNTN